MAMILKNLDFTGFFVLHHGIAGFEVLSTTLYFKSLTHLTAQACGRLTNRIVSGVRATVRGPLHAVAHSEESRAACSRTVGVSLPQSRASQCAMLCLHARRTLAVSGARSASAQPRG